MPGPEGFNPDPEDARPTKLPSAKEKTGGQPSPLEQFTKAHTAFEVNVTSIEGQQILEQIPRDQPLIVASSHLSDIDTEAIASVVEPIRPIGIAVEDRHLKNPAFRLVTQSATQNRLFPITTHQDSVNRRQALHEFRLKNYEAMATAMKEQSLTMVIAAHRPTYDNQLAKHPGIGSVTLASLSHALIVPAAVVIEGKAEETVKGVISSIRRFIGKQRPKARIVLGEPIEIDYLTQEELTLVDELFDSTRRPREGGRRIAAQAAYQKLLGQGEKVMHALASLLPPEKRGQW